MIRPRYPLRILVPALTFGVGLLGAVIVLVTTVYVSTQQAQSRGREYLTNIGHSFASDLQVALRAGDSEGVRTRVLRANAFGVAETTILFDESNSVLYASSLSLIGKPVSETRFYEMAAKLEDSRRTMRIASQLDASGDHFLMLVPLRLAPEPGELLSPRVGLLGMSFHLAPWQTIARQAAATELFVVALLVALLAAMSGLLMNALVTRRVAKLVKASDEIAQGNFESGIEVEGGDEIARLSATLRTMAVRLDESMRSVAQSQERLHGIVSNSPEAVFLSDLEGRVLLANEPFCRWFGVEPPAAGDAQPIEWCNADVANAMAELDQAIVEGESSVIREVVMPSPDGAGRTVEVIKFPVTDDAGRLTGIGMIAADISLWRRTEEQLRHAQKMKAVGQLTGGLAHDFNNILQAISGNLELLQQSLPAGREPVRYIGQAMEAASAGARLTERLLAASRKQILQPRALRLNDTLDSMSELVVRTLGSDVEVVFSMQPDLWQCEVDLSQLENAILNLAINSRDAMPDGGVLRFVTENISAPGNGDAALAKLVPGDYVRLTVVDEGEGMSAEVADRAFEPFFTTKPGGAGSGLGLSTIYGFVTQSGGHIELDSSPSEGTTIRIYLPRAATGEVAAEPSRTQRMPEGNAEVVLLVEDNTHVRRLTEALLRNLGYRCAAVPTAPEAIELLESGVTVDVLLTDVVLPGGISGAELAHHVRSQSPETAIVLMSGLTAENLVDTQSIASLGPLLQKPFRKGALARALKDALLAVRDAVADVS
ncbi:MAG: ATP-binding protein [Pseudomonadota bacterium]